MDNEEKMILKQEAKELKENWLDGVTGGKGPTQVSLSPYRCKKCGLEIGAITAKSNDGYCDKCKPVMA